VVRGRKVTSGATFLTRSLRFAPPVGTSLTESDVKSLDKELSRRRSNEVVSQDGSAEQQWTRYKTDLVSENR
jgi:hypothetical protein